mmetsp:Transcript_80336/g.260246  ORF Transcript_80336/g.260246 Transcript_80336/m.260246 type:complete len:201 (+) Transcript_80336:1462-2064(+)
MDGGVRGVQGQGWPRQPCRWLCLLLLLLRRPLLRGRGGLPQPQRVHRHGDHFAQLLQCCQAGAADGRQPRRLRRGPERGHVPPRHLRHGHDRPGHGLRGVRRGRAGRPRVRAPRRRPCHRDGGAHACGLPRGLVLHGRLRRGQRHAALLLRHRPAVRHGRPHRARRPQAAHPQRRAGLTAARCAAAEIAGVDKALPVCML